MKIAYDIKLMKPGCVIVQAAMGCGGASFLQTNIAHKFDTCHWLTSPTPDMRVYDITAGQLELLVRKTNAYHRGDRA